MADFLKPAWAFAGLLHQQEREQPPDAATSRKVLAWVGEGRGGQTWVGKVVRRAVQAQESVVGTAAEADDGSYSLAWA